MEVKSSDRFCVNLWFDKAMEWMNEQIEEGKALPIAAASLSVDSAEPLTATASETSVRFEIELTAGRHTLQGWFRDASGKDIAGAFYGRVTEQ